MLRSMSVPAQPQEVDGPGAPRGPLDRRVRLERRLLLVLSWLALWGLLAALYHERHAPSDAAAWAVMLGATGAAAAVLEALVALLARLLARAGARASG